MLLLGFEPLIPALFWSRTVRALNCAVTRISINVSNTKEVRTLRKAAQVIVLLLKFG
jgi:hypothetical protein